MKPAESESVGVERMPTVLISASPRDTVVAWLGSLAFTAALFLGLAHFENLGSPPKEPVFDDLRVVALPMEPPPPPPQPSEPAPPSVQDVPFAGIDVAASDSPVHIAVVPPELETVVSATKAPPRALLSFDLRPAALKPRMDVDVERRRIFQIEEVDQPPQAIVRTAPSAPRELFGNQRSLHVVLLILIEVDGRAASVRVIESSGRPLFDSLVMRDVKERWEFSPAVRRGKKVRCLAQQNLRVSLSGGSPYSLP